MRRSPPATSPSCRPPRTGRPVTGCCRSTSTWPSTRSPASDHPACPVPLSQEDHVMPQRFRLGFLTHVEGRGDLATTYRNAQELFVVADELGFDVGWVAQHHIPLGGGGLSSPWTFLAHAAARTRRIHLATAITILPLEHPIRLAEDASECVPIECAAFAQDFEDKRRLTTEGLAVVTRALGNQEVGAEGFSIQPPTAGFTGKIWQGVFSAQGARYAARAGSNLLLNRATYGYDEPTDVVQRPWGDSYLAQWTGPHQPRIGLSRMVFPARDKRTALAQIGPGTMAAAEKFVARGQFPAGLDVESYLRRFHSFYGHPDEIISQLQAERVLPVATDLLCQFNPGVVDQDAAIGALELIATEIAPAVGWGP